MRRLLIGLGAIVVLIGAIGLFAYFALPGILKSQAEQWISDTLHRKTTIGRIEIHPYALAVTVHDFKLMEPEGKIVFAAFDALTVDLSYQSIRRLAPVVQEARLTKPYLHVVRTDAHRYNIDDINELIARQPPPPEPARFAVNNIQLEDGRIEFEDKPAKASHTIANLRLGVPFISSLPSQVQIFVEPLLSAMVDGTPLLIKGRARPFAEPKDAVVDLNLDNLDLTRYLEYLPEQVRLKIPSARLDLHLTASFQQHKDKAAALMLRGQAAIKSLQVTEPNGKPVLKLPELALTLGDTNPFSGRIEVTRMALSGLEADVSRDRNGRLNLLRLLAPPAPLTAVKPLAASTATAKPASTALQFMLGELDIRGAALRYSDEQPASPLHAGVEKLDMAIRKVVLDMDQRTVNVSEIASDSANFLLRQDKPATAAAKAAKTSDAASDAKPAISAGKPSAKAADGAYAINVGRVAIDNWSARLENHSLPQPVVTVIAPLHLALQDVSSAPSSRMPIKLKASVNKTGQMILNGNVGLAPLHTELALDLKSVDLMQLQPYFTEQVNILLTRASLSGKGALQLDQAPDGALKGGFKGDMTLGNVATVDKISANDFLRWKSLFFGGVDLRLAPFGLTVDQVALSDFFARVIIDPSGRINLQDVRRSHPGDEKSVTEANAGSAATPPVKAVAPATKPDSKAPLVTIRKLTLQGGKVRFTDNFIKPNYTANLMDFGGVVAGLSSDPATNASVDLHGQVNSAPLSIAGRINPLKGDLSMDIQAKVRGMELAPLSPYSDKYVGYGIEKGKLSFEVAYAIKNRTLTAQNRLILEQLTLGQKVDSPSATKLPVQFALALLRDRNGVIDINLPIGGSLDDPQFSVGGIIVKVIVNVITKAITAPFALLGSLFGGSEELSWLAFDPGHANIAPAAEAKLQNLAKALADRPALKLEITGRTDSETDRTGLQRASIERKVRALKLKDLVARGESAETSDIVVKPEEYRALLTRVYKSEKFPKPRNVIGLQKDLPVDEMEKLMIANTLVSDDDLTALGNRRAQAVKEWLLKSGQVSDERIFILASKPGAEDAKDKSVGTNLGRVDFSLK
ncbi:DUF748 domain-containing protein [Herminiimonas sp. CN]|uniref:DUF748 domain-containing protein n=1 Tax=Herminiimonas sp. CN TaxID=1349818 RepID=UPI000A491863|nr:DUF748 domain-containing protein [Herminiimonas sp. CN]